jgi:hypothetical protein
MTVTDSLAVGVQPESVMLTPFGTHADRQPSRKSRRRRSRRRSGSRRAPAQSRRDVVISRRGRRPREERHGSAQACQSDAARAGTDRRRRLRGALPRSPDPTRCKKPPPRWTCLTLPSNAIGWWPRPFPVRCHANITLGGRWCAGFDRDR